MNEDEIKLKVKRIAEEVERFTGGTKRRGRSDPVDVLIATILSQNTNDLNSHRAYLNLKSRFPRWEDLIEADVREIESAIKIGGLARQKARRIKRLLSELVRRNGRVDLNWVKELSVEDALKELTSFEGVGLKTAACVLLFSFKMEVFPVDTHIHRILNRIGIVKTKSPEQTFWLSQKFIPEGKAYSFHTGLIKLGRMICRAHKPLCGVCPVYDECEFEGRKLYAKHSGAGRGRLDEFILLDNLKPKFKTKGGR